MPEIDVNAATETLREALATLEADVERKANELAEDKAKLQKLAKAVEALSGDAPKRRGRPKMSEEEKAARREARARAKAEKEAREAEPAGV